MDNTTEKRITELAERAYQRGYSTFSDFLNIDEISTVKSLKLPLKTVLFGGWEFAERCVAGFGEKLKAEKFPIVCIKISPVSEKFADTLTHRDFLGALMNLGIKRSTLGDIITEKNACFLFCLESISEYIIDNLSRIKHTTVKCELIDTPESIISKKPETEEHIVSSLRADAVIASVYRLSRNKTALLFRQEKVFINAVQCNKEAALLKAGDVVSVRGYGKFTVGKTLGETKKGRTVIETGVFR